MSTPNSGQDGVPSQVTVVGIGADGWASLTEAAREAIRAASAVAGSPRQLALLPDLGHRQLRLPSPLLAHLDDLVRDNPGLCVLASGDPTLHGIGATLVRLLGPARVRILSAVSSVSLACARLGWPQQDVTVVSLVSRPAETLLAALQPGARLLALCRDGSTPALAAKVLASAGWGPSELVVLEQLGSPDERITAAQQASEFEAGNCGDLCILAVTASPAPDALATSLLPGLPDEAYESDGQLTKRELRALALSSLRPGPGQLLWDVGAGAGSVGIEWLRAERLAGAIAIEARPDRAERAARNAAALGVPALQVVTGSAPAALGGLPAPDAVFVGGGLTTNGLLDACWERLCGGGRLVAHSVTLESESLLHQWQQEHGGQLVKVAVSYAEPLGSFTAWRPALPVVQWQATKP